MIGAVAAALAGRAVFTAAPASSVRELVQGMMQGASAGRWRENGGPRPVRAVIADDQVLMREGLALLLQRAGFDIAAVVVGDAKELLATGQASRPDLVVADIQLAPRHGGPLSGCRRQLLSGPVC